MTKRTTHPKTNQGDGLEGYRYGLGAELLHFFRIAHR